MKFLYVCLTYCYVVPASILVLILRFFGRARDIERLGWSLPQISPEAHPIWLVASSIGEVTIALKLIERLKQTVDSPIILSVTTVSGRTRATQSEASPDSVFFHPFDTAGSVKRALAHFQPRIIVLVETELWPTLMEKAFELSIPVAQVSGRISERSFRRYRALRPFFAPLIRRCSLLLMQGDEDAQRLRALAGETTIVEVLGSIKEDYLPPDESLLAELASVLSPWKGKTIFTCGSTRPEEEDILCDAFLRIRLSKPALRLIMAPRHLERTDDIEQIIRARGLSCQRWSRAPLTSDVDVLLLDTIGKLNAAYHLSNLAFVGGTLAPIGGHNLLEPALAGCPVLHGPHYFGQLRGHDMLYRFDMGYAVSDVASIAATVDSILSQSGSREEFLAKAVQLRRASSHILDEYIYRLKALMAHD